MLLEVSLLGETLIATFCGADERSLASVDPEMVKKVVPLREKHLAIVMITFQNLHEPLSGRVLILEDSKFFGFGYGLIDFDFREVKVLASDD